MFRFGKDKTKNNKELQTSNREGSGFKIPEQDDNFDIPQLESSIAFQKQDIEYHKMNIEKLRAMAKRLEKYQKHVALIALTIEKEQRGLDDARVHLNYLEGELAEEKAKLQ